MQKRQCAHGKHNSTTQMRAGGCFLTRTGKRNICQLPQLAVAILFYLTLWAYSAMMQKV